MDFKCEFQEIENIGTEARPDFEFSELECKDFIFPTSTFSILEKIISQDEQKEFYLEKSISYGDFLITSFFILLLLGLCVVGVRDFIKNRKLERL